MPDKSQAPAAPQRVLFIPVSGPSGVGEYYRSLIIATAAQKRWPDAAIEFIVNRQAGYAENVPFRARLLSSSPTRDNEGVISLLKERRPDIAVFDSTARQAQLAFARHQGIRTVYVSSRPSARRRGFNLRRMRLLDQHWLIDPEVGNVLSWQEKKRLQLTGRPDIVHVHTAVAEPDGQRAQQLYRELEIEADRYFLVCAGGGGHSNTGVPDSDVMAAAARTASRQTGVPAVVVLGPNYRGQERRNDRITYLGAATVEQMADLIHRAELVLTGGGSLMLQALAFHRPSVAVSLANDQARRIRRFDRLGCVVHAPLDQERLAQTLIGLLEDQTRRDAMAQKAAGSGIENGVSTLLDALERLMRTTCAG